MTITSFLYKLARLSADLRSVKQSAKTGSARPIVRRLTNKWVGRNVLSNFIWRK